MQVGIGVEQKDVVTLPREAAWFTAAENPTFTGLRSPKTGVPSVEALSTTVNVTQGGTLARHRSIVETLLYVTTTTSTVGGTGAAAEGRLARGHPLPDRPNPTTKAKAGNDHQERATARKLANRPPEGDSGSAAFPDRHR
ncbi:hypothetical protein GCM10029964_023460 [Kibdelosporangium lantanae]